MQKVFLDTNILLDAMQLREPYWKAAADLLALSLDKKVKAGISVISIATIGYLLRNHSAVRTRTALLQLRQSVAVLPTTQEAADQAISSALFDDIEDALQHYTALEHNYDVIITRNRRDFKKSLLPVMSADEFLNNTL